MKNTKYIFFILVALLALTFLSFSELKEEYLRYKIIKQEPRLEKYLVDNLDESFENIEKSIKKTWDKNYDKDIELAYLEKPYKKNKLSQKAVNAVNSAVNDIYKIENKLNPILFKGKEITNEAKKNILNKIFYQINFFKSKGLLEDDFKIRDVLLKGSMGGFLYHRKSDLDVAICVKKTNFLDTVDGYMLNDKVEDNYYESLFSLYYFKESSFYGMPTTVFLDSCDYENDKYVPVPKTTGVYSLLQDKWIIKPQKQTMHYNRQAVVDFVLGYFHKYLADYNYYKKILSGEIKPEENFCDYFEKQWYYYLKVKQSAFAYLYQEAYGFLNVARKALDKLYIRENYFALKDNCYKNKDLILRGELEKIKKPYITTDLVHGVSLEAVFDLSKGQCKRQTPSFHYAKKMVYGYNQKNPKAKFWKDDGLLKKQIKQKIVDIIDKKIKTKVFLGVRHENKDIIIAGRLTTKNDYKKSPIIIYSIGEIKNHNLEQKQFEQVKKEIKTIKKIKTAIFNTSDNRIMGKKLIIKLVFLDEIDFDYKKLSFNAYSVKNDKWVSKNKDTNQAKYNPKKILEEGRHIFALLEYFENQEVKKNKCACITGEIEERMESLKKELEGKLYKNTVKALLYEVVKNSKIYTSYLYYKTYCELRALSFGDYKKYLEIFE